LVVDPTGCEDWDKRVQTHPEAGFFHGSAWAQVLRDTYGQAPFYILSAADGRVLGLLPLMEVRSVLTGRRGVALPFADECAPLESAGASRRDLFEKALEIGRERGWKYVECRGCDGFGGAEAPSVSFYAHTLDLRTGERELFAGLDGAARRGVRKAEHEGLRFEMARNMDGMRTFYRLHCRTRHKHGLPPQPVKFFQSIWARIMERESGFIGLVYQGTEPLAALVFFYLGRRAIYKYGASNEKFLNLRANNLAMWEGIRWLAGNGFAELHFGRTSPGNEGLRRFKTAWGAVERRLDYWCYDLSRNAFVAETDRAEGWHNRVFRALPPVVCRWLGAAIYPHLS
jgi:CelD/BcsL family acetyltransferase involved in cellulose biosynthesis